MIQVEVDVIEIKWEGPFTIDEILNPKEANLNLDFKQASDYGVYQIYGTHAVLGPETLLYIGKTEERSFAVRIGEHLGEWIDWEPSDTRVFIGRFGGRLQVTDDEWLRQIDEAERLLIYYSAPPYNSKGLKGYGSIERPTVVINLGRRNRLPLEVSTLYQSLQDQQGRNEWKPYGQ